MNTDPQPWIIKIFTLPKTAINRQRTSLKTSMGLTWTQVIADSNTYLESGYQASKIFAKPALLYQKWPYRKAGSHWTMSEPVFRIHDILVWIRIRGSMPLANGSWSWIRILDPDPAIFVIDLQDISKKLNFLHNFFCLLLFEGTFTLFFKDKKSQKESHNSDSRFFLIFLHDDRRIRIRIRILTSD